MECSIKSGSADDAGSLQKVLKRNRSSHVIKPTTTRNMVVLTPATVLRETKNIFD